MGFGTGRGWSEDWVGGVGGGGRGMSERWVFLRWGEERVYGVVND